MSGCGHPLERDDLAPLGGELADHRAVERVERGHPGRGAGVGSEIGQRRQLAREVDVDAEPDEDQHHPERQRRQRVELDEPVEQSPVGGIFDHHPLCAA